MESVLSVLQSSSSRDHHKKAQQNHGDDSPWLFSSTGGWNSRILGYLAHRLFLGSPLLLFQLSKKAVSWSCSPPNECSIASLPNRTVTKILRTWWQVVQLFDLFGDYGDYSIFKHRIWGYPTNPLLRQAYVLSFHQVRTPFAIVKLMHSSLG